jgi:hypothetical protein
MLDGAIYEILRTFRSRIKFFVIQISCVRQNSPPDQKSRKQPSVDKFCGGSEKRFPAALFLWLDSTAWPNRLTIKHIYVEI